ncbi:MAG: hypothetical protein ACRDT0_16600 [Pseudonocardiaceae bacterium]
MRAVVDTSVFLLGCLILAAVGYDVLRTVLAPRQQPTLLMRAVLRSVATVALSLARTMRGSVRRRLLDLIGPSVPFWVLGCWLASVLVGFSLLGMSFGGVPATPDAVVGFLLASDTAGIGWRAGVVTLAAWMTTMTVLLTFTAHLVRFTGAYSRREALVNALAAQAMRPPDAEWLLASYLRSGASAHLDGQLARWARWMADVHATHTAYPALVLCRPSAQLCWLKAAMIMLDAAALLDSIAPDRTSPHARSLLHTGTHCMQGLTEHIDIIRPSAVASFEWREEVNFHDTLQTMIAAGLPPERDEARAAAFFQSWRTQYAPYVVAIATYLLYDDVTAGEPTFAREE